MLGNFCGADAIPELVSAAGGAPASPPFVHALSCHAKLPELPALGEHLLVPFSAKKLRNAQVIWLNERWLAENQLDVFDHALRARMEHWLLGEFAYGVPQPLDPPETFDEGEKLFWADRYGGEGIRFNGGSGRCGLSGFFQAKGIGQTPLVGRDTEFLHAHGGASLEEAIRETIFSEVVCAEFPHGGVPVVAIIETGTRTYWTTNEGVIPERRAILVRPNFIRPAHFERATFFRSDSRAHLADSARVEGAVRALIDSVGRSSALHLQIESLSDLAKRIAAQIAFGRAQRIFHGAYATSNVTINGGLVDFGATCALGGWSRAVAVKTFPAFGLELETVKRSLASLAFYFKKYAPQACSQLAEEYLVADLEAAFQAAFDHELLRLWGLEEIDAIDDAASIVAGTLRRYFKDQQKQSFDIFDSTPEPNGGWLYDDLVSQQREGVQPATLRGTEALHAIAAALTNAFGGMVSERAQIERCWLTAARYLKPRKLLYRQELKRWIDDNLINGGIPREHHVQVITDAIRFHVSASRRHWPMLPNDLAVLGQVCHLHCSALYCIDLFKAETCLWIEGIRIGDVSRFFGTEVPTALLLSSSDSKCMGPKVGVRVPVDATCDGRCVDVRIADKQVHVPSMDLMYGPVHPSLHPSLVALAL